MIYWYRMLVPDQ